MTDDDPDDDVRALLTAAVPGDLRGVAFSVVAVGAAHRRRRERVRRGVAGSTTTLVLAGLLWSALGTVPVSVAGDPGQAGGRATTAGDALTPDLGHRLAALVPLGTVVGVAAAAVLLAGFLLPRRVRATMAGADPGRAAAHSTREPGPATILGLVAAVGTATALEVLAAVAGLAQTLPARPWVASLAGIGCVAAVFAVGCLALDGKRRTGRFPGVAALATPLALVAGTGVSSLLALWAVGNVLARLLTGGRGAYPWSFGRVFLALALIGLVVAVAAALAAYRQTVGAGERRLRAAVRMTCLLGVAYIAQFTGFAVTSTMAAVWEDALMRLRGDDLLTWTAAGTAAVACGWALIGAGRTTDVIGLAEPRPTPAQVRKRPPGANPALRLLRTAPHVLTLVTAVVLADLLVFWLAGPGIADNLPLPRVTGASPFRVLVRVAELVTLAAAGVWTIRWVTHRAAATGNTPTTAD